MSGFQRLLAWFWWGPLRRPFEALVRRTVGKSSHILAGPLRGMYFQGGLSQILGIYELEVQSALLVYLERGDVAYDIGAHLGYFTLLSAIQVGYEGHVYAFEPLPQNIAHIQKHLRNNRLNSHCTVVPMAVSSTSGAAKLHWTGNESTPSLIPNGDGNFLTVRTITLDEFCEKRHQPSLVKIDVEGAEIEVLKGATYLLSASPAPIWIVEIHTPENDRSVRVIFQHYGYQLEYLPVRHSRKRPYPCHAVARRKA